MSISVVASVSRSQKKIVKQTENEEGGDSVVRREVEVYLSIYTIYTSINTV